MEDRQYCVDIKDLSVVFATSDGVVHAINGADLKIEKGKTLGLVGETGAGKTTTALSILRLIPDPPGKITNGTIMLEGKNIFDYTEKEMESIRGSQVSMIFQDPMTSLNPVMTVGDQIAEVIELHEKIDKKASMEKAKEMLEMVGIPGARANEYPHQFSGGMKQRVIIAMALVCNPRLLIADEPTTALDVTIQAQVLDLMQKLKEKYGTSMLMITHDLGIVAEVCDEVSIMYAGQIVEHGTLEDIFNHTGHPYTEGLMYSIPRLNDERAKLDPIPGVVPHPLDLPQGCKFAPRCRYCTGKCIREEPELLQVAEGQLIRCFYPDKMERRSEKHGKNTVHGQREDH